MSTSFLRSLGIGLALLIVGPIYLAFVLAFLCLWLAFTVSGIGPIAQYICRRRDAQKIATVIRPSPSAQVELVRVPLGNALFGSAREIPRLAVRWTRGSNPNLPPVALPNGLGATLITISSLHDKLVGLGFSVLSYDRAGVGLSDEIPASHKALTGRSHYNAEETVDDMHRVMMHCAEASSLPSGTKWILIGPSMGSIVAQAYMARHPDTVCGFLNLDGFPFPFAAKRRRFEMASYVYRAYAAIIWTGAIRPFLAGASYTKFFKQLVSKAFPAPVVLAQMNDRKFFSSLALEMITMVDCADAVRHAWGPGYDFQSMPVEKLEPLICAKPTHCGDAPEGVVEPAPRSRWEHGDDWCPAAETDAALATMAKANEAAGWSSAPLPSLWPSLVVRVMCARSYNFPGGNSFFDQQMKDWAASEHTLHAHLALDGEKTVFPTRHHGQMFFGTETYAAQLTADIAAVVKKQQLQQQLTKASVGSSGSVDPSVSVTVQR